MKIARRCPVCDKIWDKSQGLMCPAHPTVLGLAVVDYEDYNFTFWRLLH